MPDGARRQYVPRRPSAQGDGDDARLATERVGTTGVIAIVGPELGPGRELSGAEERGGDRATRASGRGHAA